MIASKNTLNDICDWLETNGWTRSHSATMLNNADFCFWKKFPEVEHRCQCNDDKPGIQVVIDVYDNRQFGHGIGFEIDITAEPVDGVWVKLQAYGLHDSDIREKLDDQIEKLIRAWVACNEVPNPPPSK